MTAATDRESLPKFEEIILGPGDFLVLVPRVPITAWQAEKLKVRLPDTLRGRVLVVDGMDVTVARETASCPHDDHTVHRDGSATCHQCGQHRTRDQRQAAAEGEGL
jgi:hypothetical protein